MAVKGTSNPLKPGAEKLLAGEKERGRAGEYVPEPRMRIRYLQVLSAGCDRYIAGA